jgi:hypothetical protein
MAVAWRSRNCVAGCILQQIYHIRIYKADKFCTGTDLTGTRGSFTVKNDRFDPDFVLFAIWRLDEG